MVEAVVLAPSDIEGKINLRTVKALCVDANAQGLAILGQTLMGFGLEKITRAADAEEARTVLRREAVDLMLTDAKLGSESGYELVRWLRTSPLEPNRYAPALIITGHTEESLVLEARDCGANFVIAKPVTPAVLMQRLLWVARGGRTFIECDTYVGPDRRFKMSGVPGGGKGRRKEDLSANVGDAVEPNMSQDEIDTIMRPQRMSL